MSVASPSLSNPARSKALMVRLAPHLVETVCELARSVKDKSHSQNESGGLLFGKSDDGVVTIEAVKPFKDSGPRSDLARRERMEKAFAATLALAQGDAELSAYKLLGWFSLRGSGGLISSDVEFHNGHFKSADDVALIVWREGDTQITAELYARLEGGKLSSEDYRWSSVRLSTEMRGVSQPIDLAMRVRINDDFYLRTYAVPDPRERKDEWKKLAKEAMLSVRSIFPGRSSKETEYSLGDLDPPPGFGGFSPPPLPRPEPKRDFRTERAPELKAETVPSAKDEVQAEAKDRVEPEAEAELKPEAGGGPLADDSAAPAPPLEAHPAGSTETAAPPAEPEEKPAAVKERPLPPFADPPRRRPELSFPSAPPASPLRDVPRPMMPNGVPELSGLPMVVPKKRASGTPWLSMALVFVLFSAVTFAVLAFKGLGTGAGKLSQVMRVLFPGTELELKAEGRGDRLLLTWNRKNPAVASASSAVLAISDGPQHFEKKLDPIQIEDGSVLYKPNTGDVTFRLEVIGTDQSIVAGSLRVLDATAPAPLAGGKADFDLNDGGTLTSPRAAAGEISTAPPPPPANTDPLVEAALRGSGTSSGGGRTVKPPVNPPAESKAAEVSKTAAAATALPPAQPPAPQPPPAAPKPVLRANPNSSAPAPQTGSTAINGWDPNVPDVKPAAAARPESPPDGKSVDFLGPKVLLQVMPNTRNLAPGSITEVTRVEVEVRIDTNGHVRTARLQNANVKSQLGAAALTAAKQWTFQPATLRGQHVESDHTIVFEFRPEGQ